MQSLENEFEKYSPDLAEGSHVFPQNSFSVMIDIATIPEEVQDELLEFRNNSAGREMFKLLTFHHPTFNHPTLNHGHLITKHLITWTL